MLQGMADPRFTPVQVLVWDFDGTLYENNPELHHAVREAEFHVIMDHTGWDHNKTYDEFHKIYKVTTPSGTACTALLAGITITQAAVETEKFFDRNKYIKRDEKLIRLFDRLSTYRHIILSNGIKSRLVRAMEVLGIREDQFETFITPEITGVAKPETLPFEALLTYTKLPGPNHLMIGDRDNVDLAIPKSMDMFTCLVWSDEESEIADVVLPTVYDVADLFETQANDTK